MIASSANPFYKIDGLDDKLSAICGLPSVLFFFLSWQQQCCARSGFQNETGNGRVAATRGGNKNLR